MELIVQGRLVEGIFEQTDILNVFYSGLFQQDGTGIPRISLVFLDAP